MVQRLRTFNLPNATPRSCRSTNAFSRAARFRLLTTEDLAMPVHVRRCEPVFVLRSLELCQLLHGNAVAIEERQQVAQRSLRQPRPDDKGVLIPTQKSSDLGCPLKEMLFVELGAERDARTIKVNHEMPND